MIRLNAARVDKRRPPGTEPQDDARRYSRSRDQIFREGNHAPWRILGGNQPQIMEGNSTCLFHGPSAEPKACRSQTQERRVIFSLFLDPRVLQASCLQQASDEQELNRLASMKAWQEHKEAHNALAGVKAWQALRRQGRTSKHMTANCYKSMASSSLRGPSAFPWCRSLEIHC